jgi:hypothetical protein
MERILVRSPASGNARGSAVITAITRPISTTSSTGNATP